jgi:tRNA nucleotidyltransferase (CCA-adding enzyme)
VWQELSRLLASPRPSAGLQLLRDCGALAKLLPEVDALFGVEQRAEYHPEIDAGVHTFMVCDMAARLAPGNARVGFAALVHDLGKALTPAELRPKHVNHEHSGLGPLRELCARLRVPAAHRELAKLACREHLNIHRLFELRPETVHDLLARCDGFRQPARIAELAQVCEADKRGRLGLEDTAYPQSAELCRLLEVARAVGSAQLPNLAQLEGPAVGEALRKARIAAIRNARAAAPSDAG